MPTLTNRGDGRRGADLSEDRILFYIGEPMLKRFFTATLAASLLLAVSTSPNAAALTPSADEPVDPRAELAQLRNTVRKAITGSYIHTGIHGACAILPNPDDVNLLVFRNESGSKAEFRIDASDPLHLTLVSGEWDTPHVYVQLAPDGLVVQFKHHAPRRNDSWASVRK